MNREQTGLSRLTLWLLMGSLLTLVACAEVLEIKAAPAPNPTETSAAPSATPATTSTPLLNPTSIALATSSATDRHIPFGLIYCSDGALWHVNADDERIKVLEPLDDVPWTGPGPVVSPDGAQVLYEASDEIWLADVATGARRNLTQTPDRSECCPQWGTGQTDVILFSSWASGEAGLNLGHPALAPLDSAEAVKVSDYRILGDRRVSVGLPALAPDGKMVAYDLEGQPWLYWMDGGSEPFEFDLASYEPLSDPPFSIVNPAWSPDGTKLAWIIGGKFTALGGWRLGIGMFDLQADTFSLLHPYEPLGRGGWPSAPVWSPDGRWLVFAAWALEGDEAGVWVMSADGEEEHHLTCSCSNQAWRPDGRWLACTSTPPGYEACLLEADTWETHPLDLPPDARLIDWIQP